MKPRSVIDLKLKAQKPAFLTVVRAARVFEGTIGARVDRGPLKRPVWLPFEAQFLIANQVPASIELVLLTAAVVLGLEERCQELVAELVPVHELRVAALQIASFDGLN